MIRSYAKICTFLFCICFFSFSLSAHIFIEDEENLLPFYPFKDVVLIPSTGRSGSTLLTDTINLYATNYCVLKTHILPPNKAFKGKIIFVFSNPNKAAESALHWTLLSDLWGFKHFYHMKSADYDWLAKIGNTSQQTLADNLLSYDALGCYKHLIAWLCTTKPSSPENAQILAIKYENLWDAETVEEIKNFLNLKDFALPEKKERGYKIEELNPREIVFRNFYNLGTEKDPMYPAYKAATDIWNNAPAFQYLNLP